jgi:glutamate synthase domain-containing protein 3
MMKIDADGMHYRDLNDQIHEAISAGETELSLDNVLGHRYIGAGLKKGVSIEINGVPGNDLAAFMDGAEIIVNSNAQDGVANTMNDGTIVVHGDAGDILGHSMRGGTILVEGLVGYRCGIHCKAYESKLPVMVVGTVAGDYLGEYMAGGVIVVLNREDEDGSPVGRFCGTGMHGGLIFVRGDVEEHQLGAEVAVADVEDDDWRILEAAIVRYCEAFGEDANRFSPDEFLKLYPWSSRPYGKLYAY